ncbi:restriction endonuclease subunit S [Listeria innocua]|uniref:Lin0523 protein n=1 Tax=Listeria innocua serovar 6a (strain ATCC BAA-680 / CLIP 11262) TaxID=272626 RepID=Q92ED7_LISIN|nr:restriction endonuclease subunit S [Listeria innocua]EHF3612613.1 restriction endonuclease subunit S [Listeria innocua]EHF3621502.1 restriction endonuclease subunit S [Listeria innocua]EHF3627481.1 restriction endonuclease subunit S [Listeria innocua]EHF3630327.1 restriction endonuclease subunit S [Listeria innocua]EHF3633217.1 restriction endonuclease subunit S [Listeria innocua]
MKKLEKSVPVIRFKGFSEAWEQRKLRDIANYRNGKAHEQVEDEDGKYTIINSKFISTNGKVQRYTNEQVEPIFDGEIAMVLSDLPNGKALAKLFLVKEDGKYTLNQRIAGITPNENIDPIFLNFRMNRNNYFLKFDSGVTQTNLSKSQVENFIALYPTFDEQYKIGLFFTQLDDTIALHQRKLDTLKLMKKGLLQQMFPKRGENIPKIRFDDFDDIWEQRILGEFLKESKIKGSNGSLAKKLTVKLWRKGVVPKEEIYTGSSATQYYIRKTGQFIYGKLDFLNQAFGIIPLELDGYESTLDSPAFDIEESINETFLLEYVSLARFYKYQGNIANGSRRAKRIHTDTFFEMPIPLPNSNEQQKIGTFSRQIDDLIALQQNKLEKLSSLKRFYLKNMFI